MADQEQLTDQEKRAAERKRQEEAIRIQQERSERDAKEFAAQRRGPGGKGGDSFSGSLHTK